MGLRFVGEVELPPHARPGGFGHAAIHRAGARIYVAHAADDAVDVIDSQLYLFCPRTHRALVHQDGGD